MNTKILGVAALALMTAGCATAVREEPARVVGLSGPGLQARGADASPVATVGVNPGQTLTFTNVPNTAAAVVFPADFAPALNTANVGFAGGNQSYYGARGAVGVGALGDSGVFMRDALGNFAAFGTRTTGNTFAARNDLFVNNVAGATTTPILADGVFTGGFTGFAAQGADLDIAATAPVAVRGQSTVNVVFNAGAPNVAGNVTNLTNVATNAPVGIGAAWTATNVTNATGAFGAAGIVSLTNGTNATALAGVANLGNRVQGQASNVAVAGGLVAMPNGTVGAGQNTGYVAGSFIARRP